MSDPGRRPDADLLRRWAAGDENAGHALFARHADAIARFFANKVSSNAADLVQETFLAALGSAATYRAEAPLRSWLLGIAHNKLRGYYQRLARVGVGHHEELPSVEDLGASPSAVVAERGEHRLLLRALRRIPLDLQVVLELRYWEDMKAREIGLVLGIPEGTVHSRLHRARVLLERAIAGLAAQGGLRTTTDGIEAWASEIRRLALNGQ